MWCCFKSSPAPKRRKSSMYMNRLLYMMFLQIAEVGREYVLEVPITMERRHEKEYWLLRRALRKEESNYFLRNTSIRVVYIVLKGHLEELPTPMLVNRVSEYGWWISLADDLVLTFIFRAAHTPSIMKPVYAEKIKKKLRLLRAGKYTLALCMISMLREITWSRAHKRFRSEQLINLIDDLRHTFLIVPKNVFPLELDTVIVVVTFMVHNAYLIFGKEIDNCLVGIKRRKTKTSLEEASRDSRVSVASASTMKQIKTSSATVVAKQPASLPVFGHQSDSALMSSRRPTPMV